MIKKIILVAIDIAAGVFSLIFAPVFREIRSIGLQKLPITRRLLLKANVIPVRHHYYEPLVKLSDLRQPLSNIRSLPGIDWNIHEQIQILTSFSFQKELAKIATRGGFSQTIFTHSNNFFKKSDAEYLYCWIRKFKPAKIVEIGSGHSTLIAKEAIEANQKENPSYFCKHVCIEPFEAAWLKYSGVELIRQRVETIPILEFSKLESGDLLFIDSSHIIRSQGDVLYEYLELLPTLKSGVCVHIHDIFSPRDYLDEWVFRRVDLWNEQYLLEAYLSENTNWKIIAALNYLKNDYFDLFVKALPSSTVDYQPGSFYIMRR